MGKQIGVTELLEKIPKIWVAPDGVQYYLRFTFESSNWKGWYGRIEEGSRVVGMGPNSLGGSLEDAARNLYDNITKEEDKKRYQENNNVPTQPYSHWVEFVDLDLPSGTLWAKCNVGANKETEAGKYFARNCDTGYYEGEITYDMFNQSWYDGVTTQGYMPITGPYLSIPSRSDFQELLDNTTKRNTYYDGAYGVEFKSKSNNKRIFIPFCGYGFEGKVHCKDLFCVVLTSTERYVINCRVDGAVRFIDEGDFVGVNIRLILKSDGSVR